MTFEDQLHSTTYLRHSTYTLVPQCSRNPAVKIENLPNLLRFLENFNGIRIISAPSSSVKGALELV